MTNDEFRERAEAVKDNPVEMAVLVREQTAELLAGVERRLLERMDAIQSEVAQLCVALEQVRAVGKVS